MTYVSDRVLERLALIAQEPDLSGTRYRLLGPLGKGGMGTVWRAEDTVLGREVAIKVTSTHLDRLSREAKVIAGLEHPGIVPVHDLGTLPDESSFYVMKLVRGVRLDHWLKEGRPLPEVLRLFQRVCEAVACAHSHHIIHRDLKPENVMVGPHGEALVMDWGLAKSLAHLQAEPEAARSVTPQSSDTGVTETGTVMGTPPYMAPEQARGDLGTVDTRSDVYSLGATLFFLLAGRAPREAASGNLEPGNVPSSEVAHLAAPKPLRSICARAMSQDPGARFASARELAEDVGRWLNGQTPEAHRETAVELVGRLVAQNRVVLSLLLAYLLVRLLLVFLAR